MLPPQRSLPARCVCTGARPAPARARPARRRTGQQNAPVDVHGGERSLWPANSAVVREEEKAEARRGPARAVSAADSPQTRHGAGSPRCVISVILRSKLDRRIKLGQIPSWLPHRCLHKSVGLTVASVRVAARAGAVFMRWLCHMPSHLHAGPLRVSDRGPCDLATSLSLEP